MRVNARESRWVDLQFIDDSKDSSDIGLTVIALDDMKIKFFFNKELK